MGGLHLPRLQRWSAQGMSVLVQIQELSSSGGIVLSFSAALFHFVVFVFVFTYVVVVLCLFDLEIDYGHPDVDELAGGVRG